MIKQLEIHYCDFCQQETNNDRIIKMPKKNNNEIIFVNQDICQSCYDRLINYLLSFPQMAAPNTLQQKEQDQLSAVENTVIEDILLPHEKEKILSTYEIPKNESIPKLDKNSRASLISSAKYPPTKIFIGGLSHNKSFAIEQPITPLYMLDSLLDFPKSFTKLTEDYFQWIHTNHIEFFLDSGAFSYMNNPKKDINLLEYVERYINFIKHFKIQHFFELDLDHMIGLEAVKRIREYLYQQTGIVPIPVWHKTRGREEWTNMCKNYDMIAIGGIASREILPSEAVQLITELCDEAHSYGTKVHGLGFALLDLLNNFIMPCDTIDTTSWNHARRCKHCLLENNQIIVKSGTVSYDSNVNILNDLKVWCEFSRIYIAHNSKEANIL